MCRARPGGVFGHRVFGRRARQALPSEVEIVSGLRELLANMSELRAVLNGPWWSENLVHYCTGTSCCQNAGVTAARIVKSAKSVVLRCCPTTPSANKWTKLGSTLDILLLGFWCHKLLISCFLVGLDTMQFFEAPDPDLDQQLQSYLCFKAVLGKRYHAARRFLTDPVKMLHLRLLCVTTEVTRYLSGWFMRRAREVDNPCRRPALVDMVSSTASPPLLALQYVGAMLRGMSSRLRFQGRHGAISSFAGNYQ
jgi:hypothetical protein